MFCRGCLNGYGNLIGSRTDQCLASLKPGNGINLGLGQFQHILHIFCFIRFKVKYDFILTAVYNCPSVLSVVQAEEIGLILCGGHGDAAESANRFEYGKTKLRRKTV